MSQREHHAPGHALVIGGGTMGVGIIAMFLGHGWKVDVVSRSASTRDGLPAALAKALAAMGKATTTSGLTTYATLPEASWPAIEIAVETPRPAALRVEEISVVMPPEREMTPIGPGE